MTGPETIGIVASLVGILVSIGGYFFVRNVKRSSRSITIKGTKVSGDVVGGNKTTTVGPPKDK
jgi:hypothetical protein